MGVRRGSPDDGGECGEPPFAGHVGVAPVWWIQVVGVSGGGSCRLWKISKYWKISFANSTRVCNLDQNDSIMALSNASPTVPSEGNNRPNDCTTDLERSG